VTIGNRLKEERERLTLTQPSLALACGTTKKTQIEYEKDKSPPKAPYLAKAASFGVDVAYVITGIRLDNVAKTADELGFLRACRAMPNETARSAARAALMGVLAAYGVNLGDTK
jgi:transcriptional regulator with XRE-family HTH domain